MAFSKSATKSIIQKKKAAPKPLSQSEFEAQIRQRAATKPAYVNGKPSTGNTKITPSTAAGVVSTAPVKAAPPRISSVPVSRGVPQAQTVAAPSAGLTAGTGAAPGGGTRGVTAGGSAMSAVGTDPLTGFAGRYAPTELATLGADPTLLARDVLAARGMGNNIAARGTLGACADDASNIADFFGMARRPNEGMFSEEAWVNTMADILAQQMTVGGRTADPTEMVNMILNSGATGSLLGNSLRYGPDTKPLSAQDQMGVLMDQMAVATNGMRPAAQRAMMGYVGRLANDYVSSTLGGGNSRDADVIEYLNRNGL